MPCHGLQQMSVVPNNGASVVADEAAPTLSVLLGRELDRPSTSVDGGFRRQIDDAVGSHRPVTVLAVDPSVGGAPLVASRQPIRRHNLNPFNTRFKDVWFIIRQGDLTLKHSWLTNGPLCTGQSQT
jgi:hypothetical protein